MQKTTLKTPLYLLILGREIAGLFPLAKDRVTAVPRGCAG